MELNENNTKEIIFPVKDNQSLSISYTKTDKLITALFMVTDIMDKDENIKIKLRNLGIEILSDINLTSSRTVSNANVLLKKINFLVNLLDIAGEIQMVSLMNVNILKKEFSLLKNSIQDFIDLKVVGEEENLKMFFKEEDKNGKTKLFEITEAFYDPKPTGQEISVKDTKKSETLNIGLQTPKSLMDTLDKLKNVSDIKSLKREDVENKNFIKAKPIFNKISYDKNKDILPKNDRRNSILKILKTNSRGLTITEIKNHPLGYLKDTGDKTLQRELVAMLKDNILYKTGEKRWSKYFLKK